MNSTTLHDIDWEIEQVNLALIYYQEAVANSKAWENDPEITKEYERPLRQLKIHLRKLMRIKDG
jgi:hypothetical protein